MSTQLTGWRSKLAILILGLAVGTQVSHMRWPVGTSSKNPAVPKADLVILGRVHGIEDRNHPSTIIYRVAVESVVQGEEVKAQIDVELPTLTRSNDGWDPRKISIQDGNFDGVFVLKRLDSDVYHALWIVPASAFKWPPHPGLLRFIGSPEWPDS